MITLPDQLFKKRKAEKQFRQQKVQVERSETWLFVCEGTKTEPNYLNSLIEFANKISDQSPIIPKIEGVGRNTKSLVECVEDFYEYVDKFFSLKKGIPYAKTFVLFDRDSFKANQFNSAINMAESRGYIPIWSNECFELWYILHYQFLDCDIGREAYFDKLKDLIGKEYDKADDIFSLINSPERMKKAIENAKKLEKCFKKGTTPYKRVPCTKMYLLIDEIQKQLRIDLTKTN